MQSRKCRNLKLIFAALAMLANVFCLPVSLKAQGDTKTSSFTINFSEQPSQLPACNGDQVILKGAVHTIATSDSDGKGAFIIRTQTNYQGVTGVGTPSGVEYVANSTTQEKVIANAASITTVKGKMMLIAKGDEPDARMKMTYQMAINANGEVTSFTLAGGEVDCR